MSAFRNIGPDVHVERPAAFGGALVATGDTVEFLGDVTQELPDGYVVGEGDNARVLPKAQWELVKSAGKSASAKES